MKKKEVKQEVYVGEIIHERQFPTEKEAQLFEQWIAKIAEMPLNFLENASNGQLLNPEKDLPPVPSMSKEEALSISRFKAEITQIITRNTRMQASPEAILGNLIMELQDLLKQ